MVSKTSVLDVRGPWSLATSLGFWEGFKPNALPARDEIRFRVDADWSVAVAAVRQEGTRAHVTVEGDGDLDAATAQVARFLALDVDGSGWPAVGERDPVIKAAQESLPGLRPCGFYSPYEAAAWAILSQRVRMVQAAKVRADMSPGGVFPAPHEIRDLDLPGRKPEYLNAVAEAAMDGLLDGARLRSLDAETAIAQVREVKGLGPFAAELVILRGANHPDAVPHHESRLQAIVTDRYGVTLDPSGTYPRQGAIPGTEAATTSLDELAEKWRPYRTWASVHLRAIGALEPAEP